MKAGPYGRLVVPLAFGALAFLNDKALTVSNNFTEKRNLFFYVPKIRSLFRGNVK